MSYFNFLGDFEKQGILKKAIAISNIQKTRLDEYIQEKEDFLAEITTQPLAMTKTVWFYKDIVLKFITNTLIIDNLAANEGLKYKNIDEPPIIFDVIINDQEVKVTFSCKNGCKDYEYPINFPYLSYCGECFYKKDINIEDGVLFFKKINNDIMIDVPGPVGEYTLFSRFENIIRNVAKHNTNNDILHLYLKISDLDEYFYKL